MAVEATDPYELPISTGGVATPYPFSFGVKFASEAQIQLTAADGTVTNPVYETDYTVTLATPPALGGDIYLLVEPSAGSQAVTYRRTSLAQGLSLPNQGAFFASAVEAALDRAAQVAQEGQRDADLALSYPIGTDLDAVSATLPAPLEDQYIVGRVEGGVLKYKANGASDATMAGYVAAASASAGAASTDAAAASSAASTASAAATAAGVSETAAAASAVAAAASAAGAAGVTTFNGRTGTVVPVANDYAIGDIENAGALAALDTVDAAQIDADAVTTAKIADDAITTVKILDGNVTAAKLASGVLPDIGYKQVQETIYTTQSTLSSISTWTDTGLTLDITPSAADSVVEVDLSIMAQSHHAAFSSGIGVLRLVRVDSAVETVIANGFGMAFFPPGAEAGTGNSAVFVTDTPVSTNALTYKVQVKPRSGSNTIYINRTYSGTSPDTFCSTLRLKERLV